MSSTLQPFTTILWASDGRRNDHQIVDYVGALCDHYCCELRIVHVVQTILPEPMPQFQVHEGEERAIAWLKARTRGLRLQGVDASLHVVRGVVGSAAPAIVEMAEAVDADLVVLHAHARRPIGSIGTAARLLATSPCPLLLLGGELKPPRPQPLHTTYLPRIEEQMVGQDANDTAAERSERFEVLIAGGGVAGLEAAFALQHLAADRVRVRVVSGGTDFVYRPLAIGEPFNRSHAARMPLAELVQEAGAELISDALVHVDVDGRCAQLASGAKLDYDALLVATGAIIDPVLEHVTGIDDARMDQLLHGLVQDIEEGYLHRLAVIIPSPPAWPLPAYELALMASERAWEMQVDLEVTLVTPERVPLDLFGPVASRGLTTLLGERRIEVITSAWCKVPRSGSVQIHPGGSELEFDRIVALPALRGPDLGGLPRDGGGFLPVDEYGHVRGADRVWAAGDCTDVPIKQGGVSADLADVASEAIAAMAGAHLQRRTFVPTVEGVLMTGGTARYLRARPAWPGDTGESVFEPVSRGSEPPKIQARYLGSHVLQGDDRTLAEHA